MRTRDRRDTQASWIALLAFGLCAQILPFSATTITTSAQQATVPVQPAPVAPVASTIITDVVGAAAGSRSVALTFDDGPDPRWTPDVLDLLARYRAVATFCLVGENAARHEDLVRRIVDAGMRLCNHSHDHDMGLATRPEKALARDVLGTLDELRELSGTPVTYLRAPGGNWSDALTGIAAEHGMRPLGWSVDSRDWRLPGADEIVRRVQRDVRPGAVILLHDGGGRREQTVAALAQLLPWLVDNCYRFTFPDP